MLKLIRSASLALFLYWLVVAIFCAWVISLPLYPSQDGPLHLYYVNALSHLLSGHPDGYGQLYTIKGLVTPYSLYYYTLMGLGHFVGLEWADKIVVCLYMTLFATSARLFLRTVAPGAKWVPFLVLPILLNWPLIMGFLNYSLSTCFALFALTFWMKNRSHPELRYQITFLFFIAAMMVTHPEPWLLVVAYAALDLAVSSLIERNEGRKFSEIFQANRSAFMIFVLALAVIPYIHSFDRMIQTLDPDKGIQSPLTPYVSSAVLPFADRAQSIVRTLGIDVFGGSLWSARLYRFGIAALFLFCLVRSSTLLLRPSGPGRWPAARIWALVSILFFPLFLLAPDTIGEHFYFFSRLGVLIYLSVLAGASVSIERNQTLRFPVAAFAYALSFFTVWLAYRNLTPVARQIATLRSAPVVDTSSPGLVMQPVGDLRTEGLNYMPFYWASAHYFRLHNLPMFNTAWLGDPIILLGAKTGRRTPLDLSFYEGVPRLGSPLLPNNDSSRAVLNNVGFLMLMRHNAPLSENPLAMSPGDSTASPYARDWHCVPGGGNTWYLCQRSHENVISVQ